MTLLSEFAKPGMSFEMLRQDIDGDTAYIVWKAETGAQLFTLPNPRELADAIAFSPDGRYLAVPIGRQIRIWDLSTALRPTRN